MLSKLINSHRAEIAKKIKENHSDLSPSTFNIINNYFNYLSRRDKWWLVFLNVVALFVILGFLQIDIFSFIKMDKKTADILIDQRTSNVATIISMTLAVIGLLLSNLAIKDNQTYKLLFVNSGLYLILYYTLSVILCLMLLSTLRDTLDAPYFQHFVLAGTYLALIILVGIGYLFRTIITFTNANRIQSVLTEQLLWEAKANLRITLLSMYSNIEFLKFMSDHEIENIKKNRVEYQRSLNKMTVSNEKLVYDINLSRLERQFLKWKNKNQKYYFTNIFFVNSVTSNYNDFIWPKIINKTGRELKFSKCFRLKHPSKLIGRSNEYKNYFDKKLHEYSLDGKHGKVDEILSIYSELFILTMKHGVS
ncbi:hypothetical protein ATE47_01360 [Chryseobacterium sp. IHB B 17019]|uniref:hypothetical protein n=1 Tax=Chryseobacterium sp. IHB B 17019 TaxID=1721091 RepID=UPI000722F138|nr:hypothetical protein [Chryseobacterium sp. IHB B 17019]ALR29260.1 hypothetical protein ATE47_01360 [Chryseobacterium sp. IHB B 17019]